MAADYVVLVDNLRSCYPFHGKSLLVVGAGGGQIVELYRDARQVLAVDPDPVAMARLEATLRSRGLLGHFELVVTDFLATERRADTVVFEFCLHEIAAADEALAHARRLADDVVVFDHAPGSPWAWHVCEEAKVVASWAAVERAGVRARRDFSGEQVFRGRAELEARVASQGPQAVARAARFAPDALIHIQMDYRFARL